MLLKTRKIYATQTRISSDAVAMQTVLTAIGKTQNLNAFKMSLDG
jgi:hypothetical protein